MGLTTLITIYHSLVGSMLKILSLWTMLISWCRMVSLFCICTFDLCLNIAQAWKYYVPMLKITRNYNPVANKF